MSKIDGSGQSVPHTQFESTKPPANEGPSDSAQQKKYLSTEKPLSGPRKKSILSRGVKLPPSEGKLQPADLGMMLKFFGDGDLVGAQKSMERFITDLNQLDKLISTLPKNQSENAKKLLAAHAGQLTAADIVNTLIDPEVSLEEQFEQISGYMSQLGTSESPVRIIARIRADEYLSDSGLGQELLPDMAKRMEQECLFTLSQQANTLGLKLQEGELTFDQQKVLAQQLREMHIEMSAFKSQ
ncbi:hypothetical protein [Endozoicomonas numazuensis]|uniref:Uncharacterized protein n=1 Tax=Endozoicomonas numazuensis TaxID=1137799 RepID=A0A081NKC4_9GAMM|nr:hypothetical protein [Endozoicomonas numazuensis]KEQ18897.1 hypothetical protein GZ78_02250 [Endozoicomonas numazuensis]